MRSFVRLLVIGLLALPATPPLQAQFSKKLTERIKQNASLRRQQTEENLLARAAEPADSAMERIASPVDSAAARAAGKAGKAVSAVGRGAGAAEEARIREALAGGRADLPAVQFERGGDAIAPASEPTLAALARVLAGTPGVFLIQARADAAIAGQKAQRMADGRAAQVKARLVGAGVPAERVFAAGDGGPGSSLSVLRVQ